MFYKALKYLFLISLVCFANKTYSQWSSVGGGMNSNVYAMTVDTVNNELYVGGWFTTAGGIPAGHIAKWDGTNWYEIGGGIGDDFSTAVSCLSFFNGNLYVGGLFDSVGGVEVNNIAMWDGVSWSNVGDGFNRPVYSIVNHNGDLYAVGEFDSSGTNAVNNIAKWDGSNWVDVGGGTDYSILTACSFNNELYIGGAFIYAGGVFSNGIAKWDGTSWSSVGGVGFNNWIRKVYVYNDTLYLGGDFTSTLNGVQVKHITKLVANSWQVLPYPTGSGIYNTIRDFIDFNGELYVTGRFTSVPYIGKFNGTNYYSLGSGLTYTGECLEVYNNELYVGGYFSSAVGVANTAGIAKWNPTVGVFENISTSITVGPNPFSNYTIFQLPSSKKSERNLLVYDLLGNLVREVQIGFETEYRFNRENLVAGVYLYRIVDEYGSIEINGKLVIVD
jgi:hypothetical protein